MAKDMINTKEEKSLELSSVFVSDIRSIIEHGRQQAYSAVGQLAIATYWNVGRRIVEEEQAGQACSRFDKRI